MAIRDFSKGLRMVAIGCAAVALAACQDAIPKDVRPVSNKLVNEMRSNGMKETSSVFVRIYKEESELEVWKQRRDGKYALLKTYDICKWSGVLGPKIKEGDRQAPEGFYTVTPAQMNPQSQYYLSFNIGFPNAYDKAHGRTGSHLMVHGACSSAGCYSMTDESAGEIFALARDAFKGGQRSFQIQAFPFRMTPQNMAKHRGDANMPFWENLKTGSDYFEVTRVPPKVDVCNKQYVFDADAGGARFNPSGPCPRYTVPAATANAVAAKQAADNAAMAAAIAAAEASAAEAAAKQQKAAEKAAAEAARDAKPGVLGRLLGRGTKQPDNATPVSPETTAAAPPAKPAADTVVAEAKPPAPTPAPAPAPKQATAAPAPDPTTVGTVVDRDFLWPEEDTPVMSGGAAILSPTLGSN
jgi:murein L,D-transpeptidase YafK